MNRYCKRNAYTGLLAVAIIGILVVLTTWWVDASRAYRFAVDRAKEEFLASRQDTSDPDSSTFKLKGLRLGMSIAEVEAVLSSASTRSTAPITGPVRSRLYRFGFGPVVPSTESPAITESYFVTFDGSGKLIGVIYDRRAGVGDIKSTYEELKLE